MQNPIELVGLDEVTTWARGFNYSKLGDLALDGRTSTWWDAGCDIVKQYCNWERKEKSGHKRIYVYSDEAPLGFWVFFDHTQKYLQQIEAHW